MFSVLDVFELDVLDFEKRRFHFLFMTFLMCVTDVSGNGRFQFWTFSFWTFFVLDVFSLDVFKHPLQTFSVLDVFSFGRFPG